MKMFALAAEDDVVDELVQFTDYGAVLLRSDGEWIPQDSDDDDDRIEGKYMIDVDEDFVDLFDDAERTSATITRRDAEES